MSNGGGLQTTLQNLLITSLPKLRMTVILPYLSLASPCILGLPLGSFTFAKKTVSQADVLLQFPRGTNCHRRGQITYMDQGLQREERYRPRCRPPFTRRFRPQAHARSLQCIGQ